MKEYYFHYTIPIQFESYNNENSEGFYANIKCAICHKWTIKILPEGKRHEGTGKHYRPIEDTLEILKEVLKKPVCDSCKVAIENMTVFENDIKLRLKLN